MNIQPITKAEYDPSGTLQVHSIFYTIQGEGPFCGQPAVFIRLWGCNLQCPSCDTEYTVSKRAFRPDQLLKEVQALCSRPGALVVITGGEPFRQNLEQAVQKLVFAQYNVQIETNGTLPPPSKNFEHLVSTDTAEGPYCFIVCSPKTGKVNKDLQKLICAYKYVGQFGKLHAEDGLPLTALNHTASPWLARPPLGFEGPVYIQPQDDKSESENSLNLQACVDSAMQHGYTLQLQIHKILNLE